MRHMVWIPLLIALSGVWLHLQPPAAIDLAIGGDPVTQKRLLDDPFIREFWPPEPEPWQAPTPAYRWSKPSWELLWPQIGHGDWIVRLEITNPADTTGVTRPLILTTDQHTTTVTFPHPTRVVWLLVSSSTDTPEIRGTSAAFENPADVRDLGIVLTHATIAPLSSSTWYWRPWQLVALVLSWGLMGMLAWTWWRAHWTIVATTAAIILTWSVSAQSTWWALHSPAIVSASLGAAGIMALAYFWTGRTHPLRFALVVLALTLAATQLVLLWSPWLIASDIRMHVRMFGQTLSSELWFTAELPCEAGSSIVPYPPLTYVIMAPIGLFTQDLRATIAGFYAGAVLFHVVALWYWVRLLERRGMTQGFLGVFVLSAMLSSLWWNSVHIGEMTNAWAHALYIIAIGSWFDERASMRQRVLWSTSLLLSHTGVTLSYLMSIAGLAAYQLWQQRRIPWMLIGVHVAISLGVVATYYSGFHELLGQTAKYPECPPNYPIADRFARFPHVYPLFSVPFVIVVALRSRHHALGRWYIVGLSAVVLSLAMLLLRDQTVRWGIAFAPFMALAIAQAWSLSRRAGWAARIMYGSAITYVVWEFYQATWQRILSYLH